MNRKIPSSLLCRIFLMVALTLSACAPEVTPTPQLAQPVVDNPNFGLVCELNKEIDFKQVLEITPFYIRGQVILTGPVDEFPKTIDSLAAAGIKLTPVILCTLNIPPSMPEIKLGEITSPSPKEPQIPRGDGSYASFPFRDPGDSRKPRVEGNRLGMNLYQFDNLQVSLTKILQQLNELQKGQAKQDWVYADPNYLTGIMADTACSSPFGVSGSPFGVSGSPYSGMGLNAARSHFWDQWAFQRVGLPEPNSIERKLVGTGEGMRVGVFDTSPYSIAPGDPPTPFPNTNIIPELKLTVHYPIQISNLSANTAPIDIKDHGLFVSSLIHAFAYDSQIDLYRVLDDAGCGDLYRLNIAMLDFLSADWSPNGLIKHAVINLSLGVRKPRYLPTDSPAFDTSKAEISKLGEEILEAFMTVQADPSIESLETVTQFASQAGMVIVAAGGNDSNKNDPSYPNPLPMELPADYSYVIGVSASTNTDNNGPACYSNQGNVAAPGGDAKEVDSNGNLTCVPPTNYCPNIDSLNPDPSCEYGVIGLSTLSTNTGYAYWVGTSFATPMVSGLAALVYQRTGFPGETGIRVTTHVNNIVDPRYGTGLINVQAALQP